MKLLLIEQGESTGNGYFKVMSCLRKTTPPLLFLTSIALFIAVQYSVIIRKMYVVRMDFSSSANDNNKNLTAIMKPKQKILNHFMNQV